MRKAVISGGTGYVGRFIVEECLSEGMDVVVLGRTPPPRGFFNGRTEFFQSELGQNINHQSVFDGADYFIHAAFDHVPGKYRGGEGSDPKSFAFKNLGGSAALLKQAKSAGVKRAVFLSSRAVYGKQEPGVDLYEVDEPRPDTLYGKVKYEIEKILTQMSTPDFMGTSLRITGVYGPAGPGKSHKWIPLFKAYLAGQNIPPRVATEVHGEDVARAITQVLYGNADHVMGRVINVSDMAIDRRDILAPLKSRTGSEYNLPEPGDRSQLNPMNCDRLKRLQWRAGGPAKLSLSLDKMITAFLSDN